MKPRLWSRRLGRYPIVLCVALAPGVHAASLVEVFNDALTHDAAIRAAAEQRDAATPRAAQTKALLLPHVSVAGSTVRRDSRPPDSDLYERGTQLRSTTSTVAVNLRQPLYNRLSTVDISRAAIDLDIAQVTFEADLQDFIVKVAQTYFSVLSAEEVAEAARQSKGSISGQLSTAQRNLGAGTGTVTDVRDAQARHDLALAQELAAYNDQRISTQALARLIGRPGVKADPMAKEARLPATVQGDIDSWLSTAAQHPSVRRAQLALDKTRREVERARAERLPIVDAVGSVEYSRLTGRNENLSPPGNTRAASVGIELRMPLFTGGSIQNRVQETTILERKAADELEAARRSAAEATERAFFQLESTRAQAQALETAEASAKSSLDGTQRAFQAGVRVSLDVLNAQSLLFQAQRDLAKARYEVLMNYLRLRQAAGQLGPEDLQYVHLLIEGRAPTASAPEPSQLARLSR